MSKGIWKLLLSIAASAVFVLFIAYELSLPHPFEFAQPIIRFLQENIRLSFPTAVPTP